MRVFLGTTLLTLTLFCSSAFAHFGMVIPADNVASQSKRTLPITLSFSHPFEMVGMTLEKPASFKVYRSGTATDLLKQLKPASIMQKPAWETSYTFPRPDVYQFVMEPAPYWEPEEDSYIVHYTKTIIPAYGAEEGWNEPLGLKTEIVPVTRPFGNYAGNSFTGIALSDGKPLKNSIVEVEYYNQNNQYAAPSEYHVTQSVFTDDNGYFTFTCPAPGWWGFAALSTAKETKAGPDGTPKAIELGAVLWVKFDGWLQK